MFEMNGFNQRLQSLRKQKKWTQKELADFLNVSGQAVSKWENGQSYPDITLMPTIASLFGVDTNFLFGQKQAAVVPGGDVPASYENLPLVHHYQGVACYASKEVKFAEGSAVSFTDGSTAELSSRLIINSGAGEIKLVSLYDDNGRGKFQNDEDYAKTDAEFHFGNLPNVSISVMNNNCQIVRSADDGCHVRAHGDASFVNRQLAVWEENKTLFVGFKTELNNNNNHFNNNFNDNHVTVELPYDKGQDAKLKINGCGNLDCKVIDFESGKLKINGSGNITANNFGELDAKINGSGNLRWQNTGAAEVKINGSGDARFNRALSLNTSINGSGNISAGKVTGETGETDVDLKINGSGNIEIDEMACDSFNANISGSGDIKINEGRCNGFKAVIGGSGDINAAGVTAQDAEIIIYQQGEVVLGRVTGTSREQAKEDGAVIKVLKRG